MKRIILLIVILTCTVLLLSGCSSSQPAEEFPVIGQNIGIEPITEAPTVQVTELPVATPFIDPLAEETGGEPVEGVYDSLVATIDPFFNSENTVNTVNASNINVTLYPYSGSTPIPLDPVDMPTPTPPEPIDFIYTDYVATALKLSFQAPSGWEPNETVQDTYILNEPASQMHDNYAASITLRAVPISSEYSKSDLISEAKQILEQIGSLNYTEWKPSLTAERSLMGATGIYANYTGTLPNDTKVRGRIHVTSINKVLYMIHCSQPAAYNTDYLKAYDAVRHSLKILE